MDFAGIAFGLQAAPTRIANNEEIKGTKQAEINPDIRDGGPCRTRTYNQLIKSQLLYQVELTARKNECK